MTGRAFILRTVFVTVLIIAAGVTAALSYVSVIEPFSQSMGTPAEFAGSNLGSIALQSTAAGMVAILAVVVVWYVAAPIRRDLRQEFRR